MGFDPTNFGLPRSFRSRVRSRHATDRQIDRRTYGQIDTGPHFCNVPGGRGIIICSRPAYDFCYAPVTYLMEYAFTFTLRNGNSPQSAYTRIAHSISSSERHATDRRTNTAPHFIMSPPMKVGA